MNTINVTVGLEPADLRKIGRLFMVMANQLSDEFPSRNVPGRSPELIEAQEMRRPPDTETLPFPPLPEMLPPDLPPPPPPDTAAAVPPESLFQPEVVETPVAAERDSAGFPWDSRIHASSHSVLADGTWRKKRGVDPALVQQVEAEHLAARGETSAPTPAAAPAPAPAAAPAPVATPAPAAAPAPASVPAPGPVVAPAPTAAPTMTWPELLRKVTIAKLPPEAVQAACTKYGIARFALLATYPDKIAPVAAELFPANVGVANA